jgi:tRNA-binding protein
VATFQDFEKLDIRVGQIIAIEDFPEARRPAYKLTIDFGPDIGIKKSSAQITKHYTKADLKNRRVLAVVNFPPKQIGKFMSEVLTLGTPDQNDEVFLVSPEPNAPLGGRLY